MNLWQMISYGGITMYVLVLCSVVSLAVILERSIFYKRKTWIKREAFMNEIRTLLGNGTFKEVLEYCIKTNTCCAAVAHAGVSLHSKPEKEIARAMEREIAVQTMKLERYINMVGTIGSTAVYVGLFGTVLGIIRAFKDIATNGAGGISVVINGISEALVCTAAGLLVAVPAVIAYNYFVKKIDTMITDMELCASEVADLINSRKK